MAPAISSCIFVAVCFVDWRYWKPRLCAYFCSSPLYVVCFLGVSGVWCMCDVIADMGIVGWTIRQCEVFSVFGSRAEI